VFRFYFHPYARVLPRLYVRTALHPRAGVAMRGGCSSAALLLLTLLSAARCAAQITASAELRHGVAVISVGNATRQPLHATLSLWRDATKPGGQVTLGDSVSALITPASFDLPPGAIQTVRLRVRVAVHPGELLRLCTFLDPPRPKGSGVTLVVRMRLISKILVVV